MQKNLQIIIIFIIIIQVSFLAGSIKPDERILYISSYHPAFPTFFDQINGVKSVLEEKQYDIDIEFMDTKRFYCNINLSHFKESLKYKIEKEVRYDVVIVADDNALNFALDNYDEMFKGLPVVFFGINDYDLVAGLKHDNRFTGVVETVSMASTIELMTQLEEGINSIYAITDGTTSGQKDLKKFQDLSEADQFKDLKFKVLDLENMFFDELADSLKNIDDTSSVLLLSAYNDKDGNSLEFNQSFELIKKNLNRPLYHLWYHGMGNGVLGGKLISQFDQARVAALMVEKILAGTPVSEIPLVEDCPNRYIFDYNELVKFDIDTDYLPEGSDVLNAPSNDIIISNEIFIIIIGTLITLAFILLFVLNYTIKLRKLKQNLLVSDEILQQLPEVILLINPDSTVIRWSGNVSSFINEDIEDIFGKKIEELKIDEKLKKGLLLAAEQTDQQYFKPNIVKLHNQLGKEVTYDFKSFPALDSKENRIGSIVIISDISEHVRITEELEKNRKKFEFLLNNSPYLTMSQSVEGKLLYISPQSEKILGYLPEELYNIDITSFFHPEDRKKIQERQLSALKGNEVKNFEYRFIKKNGDIVWLNHNAKPIVIDGRVAEVHSTLGDITQIKESETLLKESEARFKALHNASFGGIAIHDKGVILECNKGLSDISGYSYDELIGMDGLLLIAPESRGMVNSNITAHYEEPYEAIGEAKDGRKYPIQLEAREIPYKGRNVRTVEFRDITLQKNAELEIKKNLREKESLLRELYHRTKNNMQLIISLIALKANQAEEEFLFATLNEINSKIQSMALVHEKLYTSKDLSNVNLRDYFADLFSLLWQSSFINPENISLSYEIEDTSANIDLVLPLGLVVNELILNTMKHAFPNNEKGSLYFKLYKDSDDLIRIKISDDGIGIPEGLDLNKNANMGLKIVFNLVKNQLSGEIEYKVDNGLEWHLTLQDKHFKNRI